MQRPVHPAAPPASASPVRPYRPSRARFGHLPFRNSLARHLSIRQFGSHSLHLQGVSPSPTPKSRLVERRPRPGREEPGRKRHHSPAFRKSSPVPHENRRRPGTRPGRFADRKPIGDAVAGRWGTVRQHSLGRVTGRDEAGPPPYSPLRISRRPWRNRSPSRGSRSIRPISVKPASPAEPASSSTGHR